MPPVQCPGQGETALGEGVVASLLRTYPSLSLGAVLEEKKTKEATCVAGVAQDYLSERAPSQGFRHSINLPSFAAWATERQP